MRRLPSRIRTFYKQYMHEHSGNNARELNIFSQDMQTPSTKIALWLQLDVMKRKMCNKTRLPSINLFLKKILVIIKTMFERNLLRQPIVTPIVMTTITRKGFSYEEFHSYKMLYEKWLEAVKSNKFYYKEIVQLLEKNDTIRKRWHNWKRKSRSSRISVQIKVAQ